MYLNYTIGHLYRGIKILQMDEKGGSRKLFSQIYIGHACVVTPLFSHRGIIAFSMNALGKNSTWLLIVSNAH